MNLTMWLSNFVILISLISLAEAGRMPAAAREMLWKMDRSVDPCENFYEYACGKYMDTVEIPSWSHTRSGLYDLISKSRRRVSSVLSKPCRRSDIEPIRKAKIFFQSCMASAKVPEEEVIATALDYLNNKGTKWPTFSPGWTEADYDLETSMAEAQKIHSLDASGYALGPFIHFIVGKDFAGPEYRISLIGPNFLVADEVLSEPGLVNELESLIIDTLILLGADRDTAEADGKAILEFELNLQLLPWDYYFPFSIGDISQILPYFDWLKFINLSFEDVGHTFTDDDIVIIDVLYYPELGQLLETTPKRLRRKHALETCHLQSMYLPPASWVVISGTVFVNSHWHFVCLTHPEGNDQLAISTEKNVKNTLINAIKFRMLALMIPAIPESIQKRWLRLETILRGVTELPCLKEHCGMILHSDQGFWNSIYGMNQIVGRMFVDRYVSKAHKAEAQKMMQEATEATLNLLQEADWLSEESRAALITLVNAYKKEVSWPDDICDDGYLTNWYRDFDIKKGNSFLENFIHSVEGNARRDFEEIVVHDLTRWRISAATAQSYVSWYTRLMVMSAGISQKPMMDVSFPKAVNYGGAGYVIGHELAHPARPAVQFFNHMGNYVEGGILSNETLAISNEKVYCIIDQYSEYEIPGLGGKKVDGAATFVEGMSDQIGLLIAEHAYRQLTDRMGKEKIRTLPLTAEQLFFINFAQVHCEKARPEVTYLRSLTLSYNPSKIRAIGPIRNNDAFAEVFSCPVGSYMNPAEKCQFL